MKKTKWVRGAGLVVASMVLLSCSVFAESGSGADSKQDELAKYTEGIASGKLTAKLQQYEDLTDSGTETDLITEIKTVDDLKKFADFVKSGNYYKDLTVKLQADLQWDTSEAWTSLEKFSGTFQGNNHTISGLRSPLITYLDKDGSVQNLTIKGDISKVDNVGSIAEISQGTITNCAYSGTITSESPANSSETTGCGGIVGINAGKIENCRTEKGSQINRTGYLVGGIAGLNVILDAKRTDAVVSHCSNNAEVNCFAGTGHSLVGAAGGIVGVHSVEVQFPRNVADLGPQIKDCENYGAVSSEGAAAAGIVGIAVDGKIESCSNSGTIRQTKGGLWAAGIVASMDQRKNYKNLTDTSDLIYVKDCSNSGQITGITRVAGIVGGDEPLPMGAYVGYIESCINTGAIQSNGYTGGISGYNKGIIRKSFNTGTVTTKLRGISKDVGDGWNAAGGITALTTADLQNCINIGTVAAYVDEPLKYTAITGGITGKFAAGTIRNCYSSAPVTGNHTNSKGDGKLTVYYGGIAGEHGNLEGCVFNDGLDTNKAKRAIASDLVSEKGLKLSQMTGKDPAASMKSLVESGAYEYAEDLTVNGTRYRLTPNLKGMTALYAADPQTVLDHAAYAVPDTEDTVIPGDAGNGEDSNSVKTVDTGDNFPFAWLSLILILSSAAGAGAVFARRS